VEGQEGNFTVTLKKKPRYIIEDKCTGCGTCVEYCPVEYPDPFNQDISENKAVHVYFSQAIKPSTFISPRQSPWSPILIKRVVFT